jgi:hypothetical protein
VPRHAAALRWREAGGVELQDLVEALAVAGRSVGGDVM